jgi:hypothetical protein
MSIKLKKATGPVSQVGKQHASKNARKSSIFVKGYLESEDQEGKQIEFEALSAQWGADDVSRQMVLRSIEYAALSQERMMYTERKRIEGRMMSTDIARIFCERAGGFDVLDFMHLPSWYFKKDDQGVKQWSIELQHVVNEAQDLKTHYSDQLIAQVKTKYPNLYTFVMEGRSIYEAFGVALGRRYGQSNPILNIQAVVNGIEKEHPYSLKWARDPDRYQIIIDGIRAEQMQEAMDLEKSTRYATNFQNRIMKGFQTLVALNQFEQGQACLQMETTITSDSLTPSKNPREGSADENSV